MHDIFFTNETADLINSGQPFIVTVFLPVVRTLSEIRL